MPGVVRCLLHLATVDWTLRRYETDGRRSDNVDLDNAVLQVAFKRASIGAVARGLALVRRRSAP